MSKCARRLFRRDSEVFRRQRYIKPPSTVWQSVRCCIEVRSSSVRRFVDCYILIRIMFGRRALRGFSGQRCNRRWVVKAFKGNDVFVVWSCLYTKDNLNLPLKMKPLKFFDFYNHMFRSCSLIAAEIDGQQFPTLTRAEFQSLINLYSWFYVKS